MQVLPVRFSRMRSPTETTLENNIFVGSSESMINTLEEGAGPLPKSWHPSSPLHAVAVYVKIKSRAHSVQVHVNRYSGAISSQGLLSCPNMQVSSRPRSQCSLADGADVAAKIVGVAVGVFVWIGAVVGASVAMVTGAFVGSSVGNGRGSPVGVSTGAGDEAPVGGKMGALVGSNVGMAMGAGVSGETGSRVGPWIGTLVGGLLGKLSSVCKMEPQNASLSF